MPAYRAMPATGSNFPVDPGRVGGLGRARVHPDVARRFAKLGYFAIAPELYRARRAMRRKYTDTSQADLAKIVAKTPDAQVMADLDACVAYAKSTRQGGHVARSASPGFCWGGRITLMYAAHNPNVKAAVAWYGRDGARVRRRATRHALDVAAQIKAPILGLYGGADGGIPERHGREDVRRAQGGGQHASPSTRSTPTRRTRSTPTTGRAIARSRPRTPGTRCSRGSS